MFQWVVPKQQRKEILHHLHGGPMGAHLGESKTLQKLKERFYLHFSPPEQLLSDQGRQFESQLMAEVCKLLGIQKSRTTPYHPQCDGLVERWNRTLLQSLATSVTDHPENWEEFVNKICMAYNTSVYPTTGFTPLYLMFGRQAKLPVDLMYWMPEPEVLSPSQYAAMLKTAMSEAYDQVRVKTASQLKHQSDLYNQKVHGSPYKVGDHVWVLFPQTPRGKSKKLCRPWSVVVKKLSDVTYRVQEVKNCRCRLVVHFNWLKPYKGKVGDRQPFRREVSPDMQMQSEEPRRHYFGSQLELADEGDIEVSIVPSPSEHNTEPGIEPQGERPNTSRRYPQQTHHPPNRFDHEYT